MKITILSDIKSLVEYNLKTTDTSDIYIDLVYTILDIIEQKSTAPKTEGSLSGYEISIPEFKNKTGKCKEVLKRHLDWLVNEGILWRSKSSYFKVNTKIRRNTYRYDFNWNLKIDNLDRFIFEAFKDIVPIEFKPVDKRLQKIFDMLNRLTVNINDSITELYHSDKKNKIQQSKVLYNIALKIHTISYGKNVDRVFHTLTKLSSFLHKHLYLDEYKLSEFDGKQSQLTLLSNLTRDVESDFHTIIDNGSFYEYVIDYLKDKLSKEESEGKRGYLKWWNNSKKCIEKCHWKDLTKEVIKPLICGSLFSGFANKSETTKFMKERYSNILEAFHKIVNKKFAARYLQNLEAKIWIEACLELIDLGIHCLPKHDSLLFHYRNVKIVRKVIDKHFKLNKIFKYALNEKLVKENKYKYTPDDLKIEANLTDSSNKSVSKKSRKKCIQTDNTEYIFFNESRIWIGTKSNFSISFNLDKKNVSKLLNGKRKSIDGWSIKN